MEYNRNRRFNFVGKGSDWSGVGVGKLTVTWVVLPLHSTGRLWFSGFASLLPSFLLLDPFGYYDRPKEFLQRYAFLPGCFLKLLVDGFIEGLHELAHQGHLGVSPDINIHFEDEMKCLV